MIMMAMVMIRIVMVMVVMMNEIPFFALPAFFPVSSLTGRLLPSLCSLCDVSELKSEAQSDQLGQKKINLIPR